MFVKVDNIKVSYSVFGKKNKEVIVFLHGWGCDSSIFFELVKDFEHFYKCIVIDFPPFGKSSMPDKVLTLEDYANFVVGVLNKEKVKKYNILCHSFGARVALLLSFDGKIVITGGAGLKPRRSLKYYFKVWFYKMFKKILNKNKYGSQDYKKLNNTMKQTFINIVNRFQEKNAKILKNETLLIYGEKDKATPIYMAKKFNKLLQNSTLKIYKDATHFAFLEKKELFFSDVFDFFVKNG